MIDHELKAHEISSDERLRQSVGESFNIYQATVAMCSIFMGFVFSALLQLTDGDGPMTAGRHVTAWFLVIAMYLLLYGLICQHLTAHQVVRYWGIFMPKSRIRAVGAVLFEFGVVAMLAAATAMVFRRGMITLGVISSLGALPFLMLRFMVRRCHVNGAYIKDVNIPTP